MARSRSELRPDGKPWEYERERHLTMVCRWCGEAFETSQSNAKFCDGKCKAEASRAMAALTSRGTPAYPSVAHLLGRRHLADSAVGRLFAAIDRRRVERATEDPRALTIFANRWGAPAGENGKAE